MRNMMDGGGCFPTGRHYPGIAHLLRVQASGLVEGLGGETRMTDVALVAIDTETTGRDAQTDRIVEIACIVWRNDGVAERHSWLLQPERPIPAEATQVHGISDADVADKPKFAEVAADILRTMEGCVPLAYNAEFDKQFLHAELERAEWNPRDLPASAQKRVEWIDPLVWARQLQKESKSRALSDVCERLGIPIGQAHRATDDAEATAQVMAAFTRDPRVPLTYAAFLQEQRRLARLFADERRLWRKN